MLQELAGIESTSKETDEAKEKEAKEREAKEAPKEDDRATAVAKLLADVLEQRKMAPVELIKAWDDDGDGKIQSKEFRKHVRAMGVETTDSELNALFEAIDADGSGELTFTEIKRLPAILQKLKDGDRPAPPRRQSTKVRGVGRVGS